MYIYLVYKDASEYNFEESSVVIAAYANEKDAAAKVNEMNQVDGEGYWYVRTELL